MADGVISKWLKGIGEPVKRGEPLFEVESDKVTTEVESPADGVVLQIAVGEGKKVDVGSVLATIGRPDEVASPGPGGDVVASPAPSAAASMTPDASESTDAPAGKIFVTPRARKAADELGIDL